MVTKHQRYKRIKESMKDKGILVEDEFIISKRKRDEKMDIQIHIITYMQLYNKVQSENEKSNRITNKEMDQIRIL